MLDRSIGIAGLAFAILSLVLPQVFPKYPEWAVTSGLVLGAFLLGAAAAYLRPRKKDLPKTTVKTALLRLHIYSDQRLPELLKGENIFRWYFLRQVLVGIDPSGVETVRHPMTTLFLSFEPEVEISALRVRSPNIKLPAHEVKEFNQRYAIVVFGGELSDGTLELSVESSPP